MSKLIQLDTGKKRVNAYTCGCGKNTVVKHRDFGVTPMFIECVYCDGRAISHMYKVPQDLEHDLVAFKPATDSEWSQYEAHVADYYKKHKMYSKKAMKRAMTATRGHVKEGGVVMLPKNDIAI